MVIVPVGPFTRLLSVFFSSATRDVTVLHALGAIRHETPRPLLAVRVTAVVVCEVSVREVMAVYRVTRRSL